jgi:hypothetical protein
MAPIGSEGDDVLGIRACFDNIVCMRLVQLEVENTNAEAKKNVEA